MFRPNKTQKYSQSQSRRGETECGVAAELYGLQLHVTALLSTASPAIQPAPGQTDGSAKKINPSHFASLSAALHKQSSNGKRTPLPALSRLSILLLPAQKYLVEAVLRPTLTNTGV